MKYFIFSDIHGNLEALQSVIDEIDREDDCIPICLGDIVGYGPNPRECIEEIRKRNIISLAGNHDHAAIGKMDISYFNPFAKEAVLWTRNVLESKDVEFLHTLPIYKVLDNMTFVHATPCDAEQWNYLFTMYEAQHNFECFSTQICFVGHSHHPIFILQKENKECAVDPHQIINLREDYKYIINVGSVGQPRDGNPSPAFVIYNLSTQTIELKRVQYDIKKTQDKMRKFSLPNYLIERLELGK